MRRGGPWREYSNPRSRRKLKQNKNQKQIVVKLIPEDRREKMLHQEIRTA